MDFFLSAAYAQAGAPAQPSLMAQLLPLLLLGVLFYFMLIRPQMKRNKEHRELVGGLSKGDEIVSSGGLAGRVTEVATPALIGALNVPLGGIPMAIAMVAVGPVIGAILVVRYAPETRGMTLEEVQDHMDRLE